jgi:RNA polymerase sporulation-specific sigma factor
VQALDDAGRALVEANKNLVHHILKRYYVGAGVDYDDLTQIGTIGLIKAAATFNPAKSTKFATYAGTCINNELRMHFRNSKKWQEETSLDAPISTADENISLADTLSSSDPDLTEKIADEQELGRLITSILNGLSARSSFSFLSKISGFTQHELSQTIGISASYVSRINQRARSKVQHLPEKGRYKVMVEDGVALLACLVAAFGEDDFAFEYRRRVESPPPHPKPKPEPEPAASPPFESKLEPEPTPQPRSKHAHTDTSSRVRAHILTQTGEFSSASIAAEFGGVSSALIATALSQLSKANQIQRIGYNRYVVTA